MRACLAAVWTCAGWQARACGCAPLGSLPVDPHTPRDRHMPLERPGQRRAFAWGPMRSHARCMQPRHACYPRAPTLLPSVLAVLHSRGGLGPRGCMHGDGGGHGSSAMHGGLYALTPPSRSGWRSRGSGNFAGTGPPAPGGFCIATAQTVGRRFSAPPLPDRLPTLIYARTHLLLGVQLLAGKKRVSNFARNTLTNPHHFSCCHKAMEDLDVSRIEGGGGCSVFIHCAAHHGEQGLAAGHGQAWA
jgi:hypothetical protein